MQYVKCNNCGKFMQCTHEEYTMTGIVYWYECKCGALETIFKDE